ncbi:TFIIE alpha subunit-domain-containing protein [Lentinula detonsa]|uniref:TFIIE alpha subunit-domain-containing protein n=1 Tax=Lentinula detonsa TaxID=2804962 RepID=A0A9W8TW68_9AGAR|nr:TFIIE alpha subunit-domain-containing protein [Lentinula detonsa]
MATLEEQDTLRLLVQHVARGFYESKYTIILDQLARHPVIKDDDFAARMGWQPKELNKVIAVLANDCLVKIYRQNELKEGAQRAVGKQYYYIDYAYFCNVVKWRIAKMRHKIDSNLRNELDNKGYICPQCKATYTPLDVDKLMDFARGCFVCEICQCEVIDNENPETVQGGKDRMSRFNHQLRFVRAGLQKSEAMVLPPFDVAAWIKTNLTGGDDKNSDSFGAGLKIAGSDPNKAEDEGIGVVIASDKDEATRKMERDAQAELKRQQNALPSWHLKSTISGDLTALGVKENARTEAAVANGVAPTSNDDILRGLGVVGMKPSQTTASLVVEPKREVKHVPNPDVDYYEQYYASLAASTAASAQATPSGSFPGSSDFDDFGEDEEDQKPSLEYLNSLNDYRKRSRSREDEGSAGKSKIAKTESSSNGDVPRTSVNVEVEVQEAAVLKEDIIVSGLPFFLRVHVISSQLTSLSVNGKPVAFSKVTEEDHELMTPEEYTAYFEVMQSLEE